MKDSKFQVKEQELKEDKEELEKRWRILHLS
jgi:hypothetical protein